MSEAKFFPYGDKEMARLAAKDKRMAVLIAKLGYVPRMVHDNLFEALVDAMLAQQISTKAKDTVRAHLAEKTGGITPDSLLGLGREAVKAIGISWRKADNLLALAAQVQNGALCLDALAQMPDEEVKRTLCQLDGIGVWTAEMLMIHALDRFDVLSYGDFGIRRGLRMLYRHRDIDRARFERYRRRFSPYGTVASIYLWALSSGKVPGYDDPREQGKRSAK